MLSRSQLSAYLRSQREINIPMNTKVEAKKRRWPVATDEQQLRSLKGEANPDPQVPRKLNQTAVFFNKTPRTISNWAARGLLPFFKVGRNIYFSQRDIMERLRSTCYVVRKSTVSRKAGRN